MYQLRKGDYQDADEDDKVPRRMYEMAEEYCREVRMRSTSPPYPHPKERLLHHACAHPRPARTWVLQRGLQLRWRQGIGAGTSALRCAHLLLDPGCQPGGVQVEEACALGWFMSDDCFDKLKQASLDTRGVALPNFLSSAVFRQMCKRRE